MNDDLGMLKRLFSEARDNTATARRQSESALDYYDGKQWTSSQIQALRKRKQPEITINRIAPAINGVLGVMEQGQTDPRAFPRNAEDQDASEVATDSLRYAADNARWPRTKIACAKDYLVPGTTAVIVEVNEDKDPWPKRIRWSEFFYDPHSRDLDFEDARYMGIAKWMYVDEVRAMYPQGVPNEDGTTYSPVNLESIGAVGLSTFDESDEDKPKGAWGDTSKKRVLIVEIYLNQSGWKRIVFYGGGVLESADSPYQDEKQRPTNPIVAQSAFIDRDNNRYGVVKNYIPVQDEINMRRSKLLHMVNSRQVAITAVDMAPETNVETIRAEASRPDGVLPYGVLAQQANDMAAGQAQLLAESKNEIERMGPNPAVLGRQNADSSGRAQLIRQQAGLIELTPVLGGMEDLELRVYRQVWARIKQFWTDQRTVRVTDDIGAAKFLQVNEQVTQEVPAIVMGPNGPMQGTQTVIVEVKSRPAEMDMDIIIDSAPDTVNLAAEQFAEIVKLAQIYGPQEVPFDDILEASSLPKKRELIEKREARKQEAAQAQGQTDPRAEAAFDAEMAEKKATVEQKRAAAEKAGADARATNYETQRQAFSDGVNLAQAG